MPDAVSAADHVIPRSIIGIVLDAGLLAQPPLEGVVTAVAGSAAKVLWSTPKLVTGLDVTDGTKSPLLRVAAATDLSLMGKVIQLTGKNPEFSGPVVQVLQIELDPAGDPGTFTGCVVARSRGPSQAWFVATMANVTVVS
jgi:hypothetical protein